MAINEEKMHAFMGKALGDLGGTLTAALVVLGDKLGLYEALAEHGPLTAAELAKKTTTHERYVREWLSGQAASGYVEHDSKSDTYSMTEEQAAALARPSPFNLVGGFQGMLAATRIVPKMLDAFRGGHGVGWGEHHPELFEGVERFFRPSYEAHLASTWIPALEGVKARLDAGGDVADIGCGHGASTIIMAQAFPKSRFVGFDFHPPSVEAARQRAEEAGVADRVRFEAASAKDYEGEFDLIAFFDCFHDMGDPRGAAAHAKTRLKDDGTLMLVEPFANDALADNLNPVGRVFYSVSTLVCTPASLAQEVGEGLGAQAGEARLREIVTGAGFSHFRRAAETPFNLVLEARA